MALSTEERVVRPSFLLSLLSIGYTTESEPGHVAYLWATGLPGEPPIEDVLTDNPDLAATLGPSIRPRQWQLTDPERPARMARFARSTSRDGSITARVEAPGLTIAASWEDLSTPIYGTGRAAGANGRITSFLTDARRPSATVNGRPQPGTWFANPIWEPWFGEVRGSCVIGLGETIWIDTEGSQP